MSDSYKQKQEIYCHNCGKYVQFTIDLNLNGNHVFKCPTCSHEHCRVVRNGEITGERWEQRNGSSTWGTYLISSTCTISNSSLYYGFNTSSSTTSGSTTTADDFLRQSWYSYSAGGS